jgi:hypothetical protein
MTTLELSEVRSISDAPSCGVTYYFHLDDSRGVIYTPRVANYAPKEHL